MKIYRRLKNRLPQLKSDGHYTIASAIIASVAIASVAGYLGIYAGIRLSSLDVAEQGVTVRDSDILPPEGVALPIAWGNLGRQLGEEGVIDREAFLGLYGRPGGLDEQELRLLDGYTEGDSIITPDNSGLWLNLMWAFGLGNKNVILENGPMKDDRYNGPGGFASTGGWSLSVGEPMDHYSRYPFVVLTPRQQERVVRVSKGIYRPCCNNPTHFPDCNHGMAMLGLLELLAAQDISEDEMYQYALQVNSYWFSETYLTIAKYMAADGTKWSEVSAREVLGVDFSSASGYREILSKVEPAIGQGGGSCGV